MDNDTTFTVIVEWLDGRGKECRYVFNLTLSFDALASTVLDRVAEAAADEAAKFGARVYRAMILVASKTR